MNELITGLNGGNVPALEYYHAAYLCSIASFHCGYDEFLYAYYNHTFFTRNAMGVQQTPPNMVLTGMALFLSLYIMSPVIGQINTVAYEAL